jgi:hypothetical protein
MIQQTTPRDVPKKCESGYNKGTCTPMFTETLFTVAKNQDASLLMNGLRKCGIYTQQSFI